MAQMAGLFLVGICWVANPKMMVLSWFPLTLAQKRHSGAPGRPKEVPQKEAPQQEIPRERLQAFSFHAHLKECKSSSCPPAQTFRLRLTSMHFARGRDAGDFPNDNGKTNIQINKWTLQYYAKSFTLFLRCVFLSNSQPA